MASEGVEKYFNFVKNKVATRWRDLADYLGGFETADIDNIRDKHRDNKACCRELLGEWKTKKGHDATIHALMDALMKADLKNVVDRLKDEFPELAAEPSSPPQPPKKVTRAAEGSTVQSDSTGVRQDSPANTQTHRQTPEAPPGGTTGQTMSRPDSGGKPVVLMVNDEYGTSKGGISTINRQMACLLASNGAVVHCTVLDATQKDKDDAANDGVNLIFPTVSGGDKREPTLDWLKWDHMARYPNLPSDIGFIVGHVNITSRAARQIKGRFPDTPQLVQVTHVIPEDTSHYKSDEKVTKIEEENAQILDDLQHADVIFSVGPYLYDYYTHETKEEIRHLEFLPEPSEIFSKTQVKYVDTRTKVVLSIGRVKGVERLKGYDLAAKAMSEVIERLPDTKWRVRGISPDDFPDSREIIQANVGKGKFKFTPLKYATQEELSKDIQKADVVLMPSRAEPFGLVGLEAIAAGVPVLVSHKSGLAWFLEKQDPLFDRLIVKIDDDDNDAAKTLAGRIIKVLEDGRREFQAAQSLKEKLLHSQPKYWDASHSTFLEIFGL